MYEVFIQINNIYNTSKAQTLNIKFLKFEYC
jgi:hypothetical protein